MRLADRKGGAGGPSRTRGRGAMDEIVSWIAALKQARRGWLVHLMFLAGLAAGPVAAQAQAEEAASIARIDRDIVGAWRLVHSEMRKTDGTTFPNPTYGTRPHGYLIYDASHTMCVFLAVGELDEPTPPEYAQLRRAEPAAYCGRWYVEAGGDAVIHDIEVLIQGVSLVGLQRRRVQIVGDTLFIRSGLPEGLEDYYLQFERVHDNRLPGS
jgi:Lipocalin-like domain